MAAHPTRGKLKEEPHFKAWHGGWAHGIFLDFGELDEHILALGNLPHIIGVQDYFNTSTDTDDMRNFGGLEVAFFGHGVFQVLRRAFGQIDSSVVTVVLVC